MGIRGKILLVLLGIVLLIGIVGILVGRTIATDALEDEARDHLIDVAASRSAHIQTMLENQTNLVEVLGLESPFQPARTLAEHSVPLVFKELSGDICLT